MPPRQADLPATLRDSFLRAVRDFDVAGRVRALLRGRERGRVLAVGKAASAMLAGAWDGTVDRALLIVPQDAHVAWAGTRVDIRYATHPEPTQSSVAAAEAAAAFAAEGMDLALVSGGTSALLCRPIDGLALARKVEITTALSNAGVPIRTLNLVRRHLSGIKGGGLARLSGKPLLTILLSDVLQGGAEDVGSGPTVPDPTTLEEAARVLAAHGLEAPLRETLKPADAAALGLEHCFAATPEDLVQAASSALESEGFEVHTLPPTDDDVVDLAQAYAGLSRTLVAGQALVRAAEPCVRVTAGVPGRGGRCTHLAALAGPMLEAGVALLCGATDGVDGSSQSAGAVVTSKSLRGQDIASALKRFDTGRMHQLAGTLIRLPSATGLNLCDLHILARV